jgi:hypothetical protein
MGYIGRKGSPRIVEEIGSGWPHRSADHEDRGYQDGGKVWSERDHYRSPSDGSLQAEPRVLHGWNGIIPTILRFDPSGSVADGHKR